MSEPMTNIEIEDVLSSIRRLVSEDSAVARAKAKPTPLMLTPALRIAQSPEVEAEAEADVDAAEPAADESDQDQNLDLESQAAASDGSAAPEPAADHAPDSQDQDLRANDDLAGQDGDEAGGDLAEALEGHIMDDEAEAEAEAETEPEPDWTEATTDAGVEDSAEDDVAEDDLAREELAEEDGTDFDDTTEDEVTEDEAREDEAMVAESLAGTEAEQAAAFFSIREDLSLEDRIADLEAAIGQSDEEFEPDGSEDLTAHIPRSVLRPAAGTAAAEAWELRGEPPPGGLPGRPETEDAAIDAETDFDDEGLDAADESPRGDSLIEEALIDEESLREIVADLVRQELRGELGERITRNVRRLIRREIHRALALQDLEDDE